MAFRIITKHYLRQYIIIIIIGFFFEFLFNNFSNSRQTQSMSKTVGGVLWNATVNPYTRAADCAPHHHSLSATVSCSTADPVVAVVTVGLKHPNRNNIVGRTQQRNHTFSSNGNNIVIKCYVRRPINVCVVINGMTVDLNWSIRFFLGSQEPWLFGRRWQRPCGGPNSPL
jgi:hypothetical protein